MFHSFLSSTYSPRVHDALRLRSGATFMPRLKGVRRLTTRSSTEFSALLRATCTGLITNGLIRSSRTCGLPLSSLTKKIVLKSLLAMMTKATNLMTSVRMKEALQLWMRTTLRQVGTPIKIATLWSRLRQARSWRNLFRRRNACARSTSVWRHSPGLWVVCIMIAESLPYELQRSLEPRFED